jgi:hypothetical protein
MTFSAMILRPCVLVMAKIAVSLGAVMPRLMWIPGLDVSSSLCQLFGIAMAA